MNMMRIEERLKYRKKPSVLELDLSSKAFEIESSIDGTLYREEET